ncbi:MAG: PEGA domain-containing protein [Phycisphaerae bacterium]|nr:PEGA domain-containing protein [Phycisphaerae bacterium]
MKKSILCALLVALVFAQGCCSIFTSGPQTVSVDSEPPGAKVQIGPHKGVTPYQVSLPRGKNFVITATYGDKTETHTLQKSIEPAYWVNILIWPGLLIDLATGKMYKYEPTEYEFDFTQ